MNNNNLPPTEGSPWNLKLPTEEGFITLPAGTRLYAVVDRLDTGTSGPYFYEAGLAVFWHFHTHFQEMLPYVQPDDMDINNDRDVRLGVVDEVLMVFPGANWYLLEYSIPVGQTMIFGTSMVDADPRKHVFYPYANGCSKRTNINDTRETYSKEMLKRVSGISNSAFYHGMLHMISPAWYKHRFMVDMRMDMLKPIFNCSKTSLDGKAENVTGWTNITSVGIHIKYPQDLFDLRSFYSIKWDLIWQQFLALRKVDSDVEEVRSSFKLSVGQWATPSHTQSRPSWFDPNIITVIASHIDNLKDLVAFGTSNPYYLTRLYKSETNYTFQQLVLRKFLPRWCDSFGLLKSQSLNQDVLGIPVSVGNLMWSINSIIFREDIPFDVAPISIIDYYKKSSKVNRIIDRQLVSVLATENQSHEFVVMSRKLDHIKSARVMLDLVRQCNSFLLMFGLHYAATDFSTFPAFEDISIRTTLEEAGHIHWKTSRTVQPPITETQSEGPLRMFGSSKIVNPAEIIKDIKASKSWLNEVLIPPFFLDPLFGDSLKKMKVIESQRFTLSQYPFEQINAGGAKYISARFDALYNRLFFYRGEAVIGYLEIGLRGTATKKMPPKPTVDNFRIELFRCVVMWNRVDDEFKEHFSDGRTMYDNGPGALIKYLYYTYSQDVTKLHVDDSVGNIDLLDPSWRTQHPEVFEACRGSLLIDCSVSQPKIGEDRYYPLYMTLASLIRMFLFYGHCDRAAWKSSF
jgi:hypothetical protein